jgi:hypothetical protein
MSNVMKELDNWETILRDEWSSQIEPERLVYLRNKIYYSAMRTSAKSFIYYLEAPNVRHNALSDAMDFRQFADYFADDKTDADKVAKSICDNLLPIAEETSLPEKPEWISDEEWAEAQHDAVHDENGNLLRPKVEGFITGAYYDKPSLYPSEFDGDQARRVVRNCIQNALRKALDDDKLCTKRLVKALSARDKAYWTNASYGAKEVVNVTQAFIKRHSLEWDE